MGWGLGRRGLRRLRSKFYSFSRDGKREAFGIYIPSFHVMLLLPQKLDYKIALLQVIRGILYWHPGRPFRTAKGLGSTARRLPSAFFCSIQDTNITLGLRDTDSRKSCRAYWLKSMSW